MQYIKLGDSELTVSRICMGCMGFGDATQGMHSWALPERESKNIIKYGLEQGINFFDTAMSYQNGTSEKYVGRAIKSLTKRQEVILATKFVPRTLEEIEQGISGQQHIKNMLDASLKRMETDYIDLYIYHMWDYNTPIEDIIEGLYNVVQEGKVRAIGISNCYAWQLAKANMIARMNGWKEFVSVQGHYNLIFREEEREMAGLCAEENIATTPYSALASGRLSKKSGEQSKRLTEDTFAKGKYDTTENMDNIIIKRVEELSEKKGVTMTEIALAWLLTKVTAPVIGATKPHHIDGAINALNVNLSEEEVEYLEETYVPHKLVGVMARRK